MRAQEAECAERPGVGNARIRISAIEIDSIASIMIVETWMSR
jgi:hypothetical protein